MLRDLAKAVDVAYQDVLDEFDSMRCINRLITTRTNVVMMGKVRPMTNHVLLVIHSALGRPP